MLMERLKHYNQNQDVPHYDIVEEPITLFKHVLDRLFEENKPADLIALYTLYYYTAKWQHTNKVWATIPYVRKKFNWSKERVIETRAILKELGLIEEIQEKLPNGTFGKAYTKLNLFLKNRPVSSYPASGKSAVGVPGREYALDIDISKDISYNNNLLNINNSQEDYTSTTMKIPPKLEEITTYCQSRRSSVDPETFYNFYNCKGWMVGKNKMKNWHSAIATWEKKDRDENHSSYNGKKKSSSYEEADIPDYMKRRAINEEKRKMKEMEKEFGYED